jgi:hypothetical protein
LVDPSMSVNRNVTVPTGSWAMNPDGTAVTEGEHGHSEWRDAHGGPPVR